MSTVDDLLPEFIAEATDLIEKIYGDLPALASNETLTSAVDRMFRNIHTVKGGAGMFGLTNTEKIAHHLESFLSNIKKSNRKTGLTDEEVSYIREETQKIEELIKAQDKSSKPVEAAAPPPMAEEPSADPTPEEKTPEVQAEAPAPEPVVEAATEPKPEPVPEPKVEAPVVASSASSDYIRVPVQRINDSMNAISEIFLIRNQMVHAVERTKTGDLDAKDFYQLWDQLDGALRRGIGELERSTMNMRMASVQGLFSRMERTVQSYKAPNKKIKFSTTGESTELDKKVLDTLAEPLVHLIRNAIDHGIEDSQTRRASGKSETGTVHLMAGIIGNEAVIEISDDGKGIDPRKILESAKKKGLDVSHIKDEKSAIDLIFEPGFSTAEKISEISGRGVGMDAVRSSVLSLGGKIQIQTQVGQGSTFTIRLPVSVSVSPVVIININGLRYAVPNKDILEIRQTEIRNLHLNDGKKYVTFRNSYIECIDLRNVLTETAKDHEEKMSEASLLFFRKDEQVYAAQVSSFEKNTEILVKPATGLIPQIPWISGVSILPTGEPVFVLSLNRIQTESYQENLHVA